MKIRNSNNDKQIDLQGKYLELNYDVELKKSKRKIMCEVR